MKSKGIIAIIVVLILVAAGVGAGVYLANNGNNGTHVDGVKENVNVGDTLKMRGIYAGSMDIEMSRGEFINEAYWTEGVGPEEGTYPCDYDGKTYQCEKYISFDEKTTTYVMPHDEEGTIGGFILKIEVKDSDNIITTNLIKTNLDITLGYTEQSEKLTKSSMYRYETSYSSSTDKDHKDYTVKEVNAETNMLTVNVDQKTSAVEEYKVKSISEDGTIAFENGYIMSKIQFFSYISMDDWLKYVKDSGYNIVKVGETTKEKKTTAFGEREVLTDVYKTEGLVQMTFTISHSEKGFIYNSTTTSSVLYNISEAYIVEDTSMRT